MRTGEARVAIEGRPTYIPGLEPVLSVKSFDFRLWIQVAFSNGQEDSPQSFFCLRSDHSAFGKGPRMRQTKALRIGIWILAAAAVCVSVARGQTGVKPADGVLVVKNGKRPSPPAGASTKLVLEPIYTIGGGDSPEQDFSSISRIAVNDDGTVFILDSKESLIKAFDAKGRLLLSFGKKGQGPGELNTPIGILISPAKEILIEDALNRRLAFFDMKGKFLRHQSIVGFGLNGIKMDAKGRIVAISMNFENGRVSNDVKTYDPDLKPRRTLTTLEIVNMGKPRIDPFSLAPALLYGLDDQDRIFMGHSKGYSIRIFDFEARLLRTIEREFDPVPVTKEEKEEYLKTLARMPIQGSMNLKEMVVFPDFFPAYSNFIVNRDGRLIVRTYEKGVAAKEYFHDVFDPDGRYISRIPLRMEILVWRDEKLYGTEENEDGYKILKCFRTRWEK